MTERTDEVRRVRALTRQASIPTRARSVEREHVHAARTPKAKTTAVAWLGRATLTVEEWQTYGTRLGVMSKSTNWWLGDWVRFGLHYLDQRYDQICRVTGYDEQTLMNMAYVAKNFPVSRRRENLSWSHHAELAPLPSDEQDRWLDLAVAQKLSVRQLRTKVRLAQRVDQPSELKESGADSCDLPVVPEDAELLFCPCCGASFTLDELRHNSGESQR
jgi:hypothetical protein